MACNADFAKTSVCLHPFIDMVGIFYLVGDRHLLEVTFTFAMTVEVETNAGNSSCLQLVSNADFQATVPVACESMT